MAEKTTNYQCPACTGPLHYDGASGKLVCDYCGSAYDVKDIEARYAKKQAAAGQSGVERGRGGGLEQLLLPHLRGRAGL